VVGARGGGGGRGRVWRLPLILGFELFDVCSL
jgi:hypothetical protein